MANFIRAHLILSFFGLAFLISWAIWIPLTLYHFGFFPIEFDSGFVPLGRLLGTLGPAISAIIISMIAGGTESVKNLLGKIKQWRVNWTWYIAATLVFPALYGITAALYILSPQTKPLPIQSITLSGLLITSIIMIISVLGEEIGWRGFALPQMQKKWTALTSSIILGTIWTIWHLPFWALLDELETYGWGYWFLSWAFILAGSIYITWLMNNTRNSLLIILIFHWSYNILSVAFIPISSVVSAYKILIILTWIVAFGLLIRFGPKRLSRTPN